MVILDTNVFSELLRPAPAPEVSAWLRGNPSHEICTTSITMAEILAGVERMPAGKRRTSLERGTHKMLREDLAGRILPFDEEPAAHYAGILARRKALGRPISQFDAMIAAIARSHGAILATRDMADFEHCGIRLANPWRDKL